MEIIAHFSVVRLGTAAFWLTASSMAGTQELIFIKSRSLMLYMRQIEYDVHCDVILERLARPFGCLPGVVLEETEVHQTQ